MFLSVQAKRGCKVSALLELELWVFVSYLTHIQHGNCDSNPNPARVERALTAAIPSDP